jgi:hypothetical protein
MMYIVCFSLLYTSGMRAEMLLGVRTDRKRVDFNRRSGVMRTLLVRKFVVILCMPNGGYLAVMRQPLRHRRRSSGK